MTTITMGRRGILLTGFAGTASGPATPTRPAAPFFKGSAAWATGDAGSD